MLKAVKTLAVIGGLCVVSGAQAVAISNMDIAVDWASLAITGPLGNPSTFTNPITGEIISSEAEGWGGTHAGSLSNNYAINGASAITVYSDAMLNLRGGYDNSSNTSGGAAVVTNSGNGVQSGWAGGYRGFFYEATGTGQVTVSVNYVLTGMVSTTSVFEYANGGYSVLMDAGNADLWLSTYSNAIGAGSDEDSAIEAADLAASLYKHEYSNWQVIESFNCWDSDMCSSSVNDGGVMSVTFDVVAGTRYHFGFDATASGYTQVSAVPVPAAAWLFGSGLVGLIGMARRRAA